MIQGKLRPLVYVVSRLPVGSQTFVEREWRAVGSIHKYVYVYGLEPLNGRLMRFDPATSELTECQGTNPVVDFIRALAFSVWSLISLGRRPRATWHFVHLFSSDRRLFLRCPYVVLHSIRLATQVRMYSNNIPHVHAHFLGRTFEVSCGLRLIIPKATISGTGHAGDVCTPMSMERLRALVNEADQVIGASDDIRSRLAGLLDAGRPPVATVRCGVSDRDLPVDVPYELPEGIDPFAENRPRLLSVGRVVEKKGFDDCVAASAELAENAFDHQWVIVGDGPMRADLEVVAGREAGRHLLFAGETSNENVMYLLKTWADIFVLPAKPAAGGDTDGIPVVLMEAMRSGVPVVTTHVGGIHELVEDGVTGIVVPKGDPRTLASAVEALWSDPTKVDRIVDSARVYVEAKFDVDTEARRLHRLLFGSDSASGVAVP